jgi:hypothetical protein
VSKKHILTQKANIVIIHLYQIICAPESLSLYKESHMGANDSKCIAKANVGEIDPQRMSQKNIFLSQKSYIVMMNLYQNRLS